MRSMRKERGDWSVKVGGSVASWQASSEMKGG